MASYAARGEAARLLSLRDFDGAAASLGETELDDPTSEALFGVVQFLAERYDEAAAHFARALELRPGQPEWTDMLALARANSRGEVNVFVPELQFFDADRTARRTSASRRCRRHSTRIGPTRIGVSCGTPSATESGWPPASPGTPLRASSGGTTAATVWTNWYRKRLYKAILTLAYMRDKLNRDNLKSTYPLDAMTGFAPADLVPPIGVTHFRTADGSWNNLDNPKEGAAGTRFPRNVANSVIRRPTDEELLSPNPRTISRKLLTPRRDDEGGAVPQPARRVVDPVPEPRLDQPRRDPAPRDVIEIPLDEDDPARRRFHQRNMFVGRTQPDPTRREDGEPTPVTFINEVTHWWDGSQIYGSDQATQDRLRSGVDGKLRLADDGTLPLDRQRSRGHRLRPQLVGRPVDAAHAVRARAQRDLRPPASESIPTGTTTGCSTWRAW